MVKVLIRSKDVDTIKKRIIINSFVKNKVYHLHNSYHLGDNVFNFILFYLIKDYIEDNNIKIFYYANNVYLPQLKEFISSNNIFLSSLEFKPSSSIELWINEEFFNYTHVSQNMPCFFNDYYKKFFTKVLTRLNITLKISKFYYEDSDYL